MQVSVIIPAYKAAGTICRTIDSVLAQTHPAHEIIVVDDGSPDDQVPVIQRTYGDRVFLIRQPNGRTARARNTGIAQATGEVIAFVDADDYWEPEKLQRQIAVLQAFPQVGIVAGDYFSQAPGQERTLAPVPARPQSDYDHVLHPSKGQIVRIASSIWTGMVAIRRTALGDERFVSGLEPAEDRDLWIRMLRHPVYLMQTPLATAVLEPGSISRVNLDIDCENMLRVIRRHRGRIGLIGSRKWTAEVLYRWAALDPCPKTALPRLWRSLLCWPLPCTPRKDGQRFARLKRMLVLLGGRSRRADRVVKGADRDDT